MQKLGQFVSRKAASFSASCSLKIGHIKKELLYSAETYVMPTYDSQNRITKIRIWRSSRT